VVGLVEVVEVTIVVVVGLVVVVLVVVAVVVVVGLVVVVLVVVVGLVVVVIVVAPLQLSLTLRSFLCRNFKTVDIYALARLGVPGLG
jgi:hypothetical protein